MAWLDMKTNTVDVVIGPIESYIDRLTGQKTAAESYVLIKDKAWSARLARYAALLPVLQHGLPVPEAYKRERPGTDSDLNAYDAFYYAGDANAGSRPSPSAQREVFAPGHPAIGVKNVMRAKFDRILVPIAGELIAEDQQSHAKFDAFFANVMFHEVAHGLGLTHTIDGKRTVRDALKEQHSALEEGKADILGLYMVTRLPAQGELTGTTLEDHYVTFLASIFRSVRFGAGDAHGRANAAQLSYFEDHGALVRDSATGRYRVDFPKMRSAVDLSELILKPGGDGDTRARNSSWPRGVLVHRHRRPARLGGKRIPGRCSTRARPCLTEAVAYAPLGAPDRADHQQPKPKRWLLSCCCSPSSGWRLGAG
jgi:hypothetical protein